MSYLSNNRDRDEEEQRRNAEAAESAEAGPYARSPYAQVVPAHGYADYSSYPSVSYGYTGQYSSRYYPDSSPMVSTVDHWGYGQTQGYGLDPWGRTTAQAATVAATDADHYTSPLSYIHAPHSYSPNVSGDDPMSPSQGSEDLERRRSVTSRAHDANKRYTCPDCPAAFSRKADKDRHYECVHNRSQTRRYDCPILNCSRVGDASFTRKDHLTEHLRNYHHQNIPKRRKVRGSIDRHSADGAD